MDYLFILFILFDIIFTFDFVFKFIKKKKEEREIKNQIKRLTALRNLIRTKNAKKYLRLNRKERLKLLIKHQKREAKKSKNKSTIDNKSLPNNNTNNTDINHLKEE